MNRNLGIIGYGNMGSAIGQQLISKYNVFAFDKQKDKTKGLSNINVADKAIDLVNNVETIILAVKPQDFDTLLNEIKNYVDNKLIISIAAGITTGYIEKLMGWVRVVRVMPNLPAKIGKGMSCLCKGKFATDTDLKFAQELFKHLGETLLIKESLMPAATAISGSGPGFFYHLIKDKVKDNLDDYATKEFIPALSASAQKIGFSTEQADLLAGKTTAGSIALLRETKLSPTVLCIQVASKGGTTEAGLNVLDDINSLPAATHAALMRAKELSQ